MFKKRNVSATHQAVMALILVTTMTIFAPSVAFIPLFGGRSSLHTNKVAHSRSILLSANDNDVSPSAEAVQLKESLLTSVKKFREVQERDGSVAVDFGVKGGELNETSRAPQKVNYYGISQAVGEAADNVISVCESLSKKSPTKVPTQYLGDKKNGTMAPLHGTWRLLFTTAADASFASKNSTRGTAKVSNVVDATKGRFTNVIEFDPKPDGSKPVLDSLNVVIEGKPASNVRVNLRFIYAKLLLNKFFFFPLFGKKLRLYIPVPGPFITRLIVLFSRIIKFGKKAKIKKPPKAYFDVLYLDKDLRIQRTGDDNFFVQAKETWNDAKPLLQ